ncbi:MAG TPA: class I SAM-dependent methyltransferase [Bryobacteraceae bacterium]|nr:class I SAM-dependent methyltransferase [Bryobacteraceae bacterium]
MTNPQSIGSWAQRQINGLLLAGWLLVGLLFAGAAAAPAFQSEHPLTGRRIAPVMGVGGADWLERSEREMEEHPDAALDAIGIKPGMVVADVGAGTGYMTLRMARRVGPSGKVYANDVQPEMLRRLRQNAAKEKLANIETVLGTEADPKLPPGKLDLILLVDVYHEFSQPQKMLQRMREALKPDGRLVLLEYRKEDPSIPIRPEHKMSVQEVKTEVEAEGFRMDQVLETLPRQHILILKKTS